MKNSRVQEISKSITEYLLINYPPNPNIVVLYNNWVRWSNIKCETDEEFILSFNLIKSAKSLPKEFLVAASTTGSDRKGV